MVNGRSLIGALILSLATTGASSRWTETDFQPRPVAVMSYSLSENGSGVRTVVGAPRSYTIRKGDTLWDVARYLGLGINEVQDAFPDLDVWVPTEELTLPFPTFWILPKSDYRGIVINIPEMRLYYFPQNRDESVITYPVGLGREDWQTPVGRFRITEKTVNPSWVIPAGIREERIRDKRRFESVIPGGDPDNPLGKYRMRLSLALYGIHGTNIPWGVGMQVSHGCVRLYPEDIEKLFPLVRVGAPGEFVYEPVKVGARDGDVYVEVHKDVYATDFDYWNETRVLLEDQGWENLVDFGLVADAINRKSGVPTRISVGRPLFRWNPEGEISEASSRRFDQAESLTD